MARILASSVVAAVLVAVAAPAVAQTLGAELLALETDRSARRAYGASGYGLGRFMLYPAVEISTSFARGSLAGGPTFVVSPELLVVTDTTPQIRLTFDADLIPDAAGGAALIDAAKAEANVQLNLPGEWRLNLRAGYSFTHFDDGAPAGLDTIPPVHNLTGGATFEGPLGGLALRTSFGVDRHVFEDGTEGGLPVDQSDRNNTAYAADIRIATDGGGRITPFVEAGIQRRIYDNEIDTDGFLQNGTSYNGRVGFNYDSLPVLSAELALGYYRYVPDDPALRVLSGTTFNVNVQWSPRELVTLSLNSFTSFNPEPTDPVGGSTRQEWTLRGTMDVREDVTISLTGVHSTETFGNGDVERQAQLRGELTLQPTEWIRISAGVTQQWVWSPDPLKEGSSLTFGLTARLTR